MWTLREGKRLQCSTESHGKYMFDFVRNHPPPHPHQQRPRAPDSPHLARTQALTLQDSDRCWLQPDGTCPPTTPSGFQGPGVLIVRDHSKCKRCCWLTSPRITTGTTGARGDQGSLTAPPYHPRPEGQWASACGPCTDSQVSGCGVHLCPTGHLPEMDS